MLKILSGCGNCMLTIFYFLEFKKIMVELNDCFVNRRHSLKLLKNKLGGRR